MNVTKSCGKQSDPGIEVESSFARLAGYDDFHQLINEIAIGLEKRSGADTVGMPLRLVDEVVCTGGQEFFGRMAGSCGSLAKGYHSHNFGHRSAQVFCPGASGGPPNFACTRHLDQQL